ncbi:MAG: efflux RND transporter permease subunit, partial [Planctomycetota bacterium]
GTAGDLESIEAIETQLRRAQESGIRKMGNAGKGNVQNADPEASIPDSQFPNPQVSALSLPPGYSLEAVGSFRNQIEANRRLMWIIPLVLFINLSLIYLQFRNLPISLAVFSGIPVAFAGGMIAVAFMDVQLNTAVWVGFIALFGVAVDDGVVMATYIHQRLRKHPAQTAPEIREAIYEAGQKRIRPCVMTTVTTLVALLPVMFADGRGADVARAMAIPVFGGMLVEPLTSFIVPTVYAAYLESKIAIFGSRDLETERLT